MPGADSDWDWRREDAVTALINEADIDAGTSDIITGSSSGGGGTLIDAPFTAFWRDNCIAYVDMYRCVLHCMTYTVTHHAQQFKAEGMRSLIASLRQLHSTSNGLLAAQTCIVCSIACAMSLNTLPVLPVLHTF
jgi:hypothetical protein